MKHLFIVNPIAGGFDRTDEIAQTAKAIFTDGEDFEVYTTQKPMDAAAKIRAEAEKSADLRVYSVGGDGTFHECINGAVRLHNVAVAVYPSGTGNDFVRMFGEEKQRFSDISELIGGEIRPIDLIEYDGHYGVNTCSMGLDARIGTDIHKYRTVPLVGGKMSYITSVVVNVIKGITDPLRVSYGNTVYEGDVTLACVCNGQFYGGGFRPIPEADICDGKLDFLMIKKISRATLIGMIGKYSKGQWRTLPAKHISYYRGESVTIESKTKVIINMDGEQFMGKKAEFKLAPKAVRCIFPKNLDFFADKAE